MPTKLNRGGEQQEYNASNGEYSSSSSSSTASNANQLRRKAFKMGLKLDYIGRRDTSGGGIQRANATMKNNQIKALEDNGFTQEEINTIVKDAEEKQKKKSEGLKNFLKQSKDNYLKKSFGEDVKVDQNGKSFTFKHYIDDDNINIVTHNVSYWKNKDTYVMWVDNDKVIYLKSWNVTPVRNEKFGDAYSVKLNRQYFKPYKTYTTEEFYFSNEETFDDLLKVSKEQDEENIKWRL